MQTEIIGNATLYMADSREIAPTIDLQCLVTDPPFGMNFQSNHRSTQHKFIENDDTEDLLLWACNLKPRHSSYIFCRWDNFASVPKPKSVIQWVKNNWSMGDLKHEHGRQTETILFYPGPEHDWPTGRPSDVVFANRTGNSHHPTEKSGGLFYQIIQWTRGTVCDPFMGGGGSGVAAHMAGRDYIGIEYDQTHFDTACRRIEAAQKTIEMFMPQVKQLQLEVATTEMF